MKRLLLITVMILIFIFNINVYAMDSVYSLNKNKDEKFTIITKSYNDKHEVDGIIAAGNYCEETKENEDDKTTIENYQLMIVKYNKDGKVKWNFKYGNTSKDELDYMTYSYDEESNINGYIIVLKNSYNISLPQEEKESLSTIIKISLDGKKVWEKNSNVNKKETITKIIPTFNEENKNEGYVGIGTTNDGSAMIVKYDKEFNVVWDKEYKNPDYEINSYEDITNIYEENKIIGFVVVRKQENIKDKNKQIDLIRFDKDGNEIKNIDNTLNKYDTVNLQTSDNGFIIYGKTSDLKLKKGTTSYYIIKYSSDNTEEWETIGDVILDDNGKVVVNPIINENKIEGYHLLCTNEEDASTYVIKIDEEGNIKKKIKKITNEYYDIEDFLIHKDVIYFVGQIICPEDDNCEYDTNSLFLVSDEDKVIEVKDNQSANVLIFIGVFIIGCFGISFLRKRKKMN
jgi:hypothetical protein